MTGIVSLCEQLSAAIHVCCVTVWVSAEKKGTKVCLLVSLFSLHVTTAEMLKKYLRNFMFSSF
jgi:hypothetical protein